MTNAQLWQLYQQTHFLLNKNCALSDEFAILTACNPRSAGLNHSADKESTAQLVAILAAQTIAFQPIVGTSADLQHQEASFCCQCSHGQARNLCLQFAQNAYFYVEGDRLRLIPVLLDDQSEVELGSFRARLISSDNDTA